MNQVRKALVFGASGFLGRHLIAELFDTGVHVVAATRSERSFDGLRAWLSGRGYPEPSDLRVDFEGPELVSDAEQAMRDITEIYDCSGAYRWGMGVDEARRANVENVRAIVRLAAHAPALTRIVHVSGYRVAGDDPPVVPWSTARIDEMYRRLGAYEASKIEGDEVFRATATELGVSWSVVNPSTVIGVSTTGESDQELGLAANLRDIWNESAPALAGNSKTFVPVVSVDYLAEFMTVLPVDPAAAGKSFWVLDDATPGLPDLLTMVGRHYRVKVPQARIPVSVVKQLPQRLSKAEPETLTFLSDDRYPTNTAETLAHWHGLRLPDTTRSILNWADYLAAHRFGAAPDDGLIRRFDEYADTRTYTVGVERAQTFVLPGLPVNADSWAPVVAALGDGRAVDLPGLGMSSGDRRVWERWMEALLAGHVDVHLVGHSIGSALALQYAAANPEQIGRLTLVAPFFLQEGSGLSAQLTPMTRWFLRRADARTLSLRLTGTGDHANALEPAALDLRRAQVASHVASLFAATTRRRWRSRLHSALRQYPGRVHVIVGTDDALSEEGKSLVDSLGPRVEVTTIAGAGHHPQLTHADALAELMRLPVASGTTSTMAVQ